MHGLAVEAADIGGVFQDAFHVAADHARARELRDVHRRIVMQFLGELNAADGLETVLRREQKHAPFAGAIVDEAQPGEIEVDGRKRPLENVVRRGAIIMTLFTVCPDDGQALECDRLRGRHEEEPLHRPVEHPFVQPHQALDVIAFEPLRPRPLF